MNERKKVEKTFMKDALKALEDDSFSIFAGAGLSMDAGYVDWATLLKPLADEIGLDSTIETNMVQLAQYYCNESCGRGSLNQQLTEMFHTKKNPTKNHEILSRLPIRTYWTTNYDKLIELSLENRGKIVDVKYTTNHLVRTLRNRDAIVYKMHGDVEHTDTAIITKEDYDLYPSKHEPFLTALRKDLVDKMFLFIGLSFSDPNLDSILSQVRVSLNGKPKKHYCILKNVIKQESESDEEFTYRKIKHQLFVNDLKNYGIVTLLIDDYGKITDLLQEVENEYRKKTVFISGAAHDYAPFLSDDAIKFVSQLSKRLIEKGYRIVSGFGLGIGSAVITGALEEIYLDRKNHISDQLILRPFPQFKDGEKRKELWSNYRKDMISLAGVSIFLFGNKLENNKIILSEGMNEEYVISKNLNNVIIPLPYTESQSRILWNKEIKEMDDNNDISSEFKDAFRQLNNADIANIYKCIDDIINLIEQKK